MALPESKVQWCGKEVSGEKGKDSRWSGRVLGNTLRRPRDTSLSDVVSRFDETRGPIDPQAFPSCRKEGACLFRWHSSSS